MSETASLAQVSNTTTCALQKIMSGSNSQISHHEGNRMDHSASLQRLHSKYVTVLQGMRTSLLQAFATHQAELPGHPEAEALLDGPMANLIRALLTELLQIDPKRRAGGRSSSQRAPHSSVALERAAASDDGPTAPSLEQCVMQWIHDSEAAVWDQLEMALSLATGGAPLMGGDMEADDDNLGRRHELAIKEVWETAWESLEALAAAEFGAFGGSAATALPPEPPPLEAVPPEAAPPEPLLPELQPHRLSPTEPLPQEPLPQEMSLPQEPLPQEMSLMEASISIDEITQQMARSGVACVEGGLSALAQGAGGEAAALSLLASIDKLHAGATREGWQHARALNMGKLNEEDMLRAMGGAEAAAVVAKAAKAAKAVMTLWMSSAVDSLR